VNKDLQTLLNAEYVIIDLAHDMTKPTDDLELWLKGALIRALIPYVDKKHSEHFGERSHNIIGGDYELVLEGNAEVLLHSL
jgi:hypothetical protein